MRFKGPDSSSSALMGCKSSVAETTGNSNARRQPKSTNERERRCFPAPCADADSRRQTRTAGSANISHKMLRSSSILRVLLHDSSVVTEIVPATFGGCRIEITASLTCEGPVHGSPTAGTRFSDSARHQEQPIRSAGITLPGRKHRLLSTTANKRASWATRGESDGRLGS